MINLNEPAFPTKGDETLTGLTKGEFFTMIFISANGFKDARGDVRKDLEYWIKMIQVL